MAAYRIMLPSICKSEQAVLIAVYLTQPATTKLIAVTCQTTVQTLNRALDELCACKLLKREKIAADQWHQHGRRPWVYCLRTDGLSLAKFLTEANNYLNILQNKHPDINYGNHRRAYNPTRIASTARPFA